MNNEDCITIKLSGNLAATANGARLPELTMAAPAKLSEVISRLRDLYQIDLRRDSVLILVNGVEANALDDLETVVRSKDQVVFVPMFHGGIF